MHTDLILAKIIDLSILLLLFTTCCKCQEQQEQEEQPEANCTRFYRNTQRHGAFLMGQVKLPLKKIKNVKLEDSPADSGDEHGFKLHLKFSRSIRSMNVRQAKAKDMGGSHTEFMIDTTAADGVMKLDTMVRLRSLRGHLPRVTRVVFNNKVLCGPPLTESELYESVVVNAPDKKTKVTAPTTKSSRYFPVTSAAIDEFFLQEDY